MNIDESTSQNKEKATSKQQQSHIDMKIIDKNSRVVLFIKLIQLSG